MRSLIVFAVTVALMSSPIGDPIRGLVRPAMGKAYREAIELAFPQAASPDYERMSFNRVGETSRLGFDHITVLSRLPVEAEDGGQASFYLVETEKGLATINPESLVDAVEKGIYRPE